MTSLRDKLALWFSAVHRASAATVDSIRNPAPPPELAKWPDLPSVHWVSSHVSNPAAQRILEAVRPVEHRRRPVVEGGTSPLELAQYRGHIREKLSSSGLAPRLIEGETMLPDIAAALPWPWSAWARLIRPRSIEAWAKHVRRNLNWYLEPDKPLRPSCSVLVMLPFFVLFPKIMNLPSHLQLPISATLAAAAVTLYFLSGRSRISSPNSGPAFLAPYAWFPLAALCGLVTWLMGGSSFALRGEIYDPWLVRLLSSISTALHYLSLFAIGSLMVRGMSRDELWARLPGSDAAQINAEELYLYLYDQYGDSPKEEPVADVSGQGISLAAAASGPGLVDHVDHIESRDVDEAPDDPGQDHSDQQNQQGRAAAGSAKQHL